MKRLFRAAAAIAMSIGLTACSEDDCCTSPPVAVRLALSVQPSASAASGVPLATQPVVQVLDNAGNPIASRGQLVTASLASGPGTLTGETAIRTDADGKAAFSTLTLSGPVGPRTLRFSASGLSAVLSQEITMGPGPVATANVIAGNNQTAPAGTTVPVAPAVRVADGNDNPIPGVTVTFAVVSGGGSVAGSPAVTNPQGVATLGQWTLGTTVGANSLSASVAGVTQPLVVSATGVVGAAATIAAVEGDAQSATIGNPVMVAPAAKVMDAFGNVIAGVSVTFAPAAGSGSVTGGTAITDAAGIARVGSWRLGLAPGSQTLTASRSGATSASFTATAVDFPVTGIAAGGAHTCAVTDTGTRCWGDNSTGQFGNGATAGDSVPVAAAGALAFTQVAAGNAHSCGLTAAGAAWCWGNNSSGQLGDGTGTTRTTPVAVGGGFSFKQISAGGAHTCALRMDGAAYCWGAGANGRLGNGGTATTGNPVAVSGAFTYTAIAAGGAHTCAVRNDGAVLCWGLNANGRLGDGTTTDRTTPTAISGGGSWLAVGAGATHSCAINSAGAGFCWGNGASGQLGTGTATSQSSPTGVTGGHTFASLAVGANHSCALTAAGAAHCWGANLWGTLGDGTTTVRNAPTAVSGGATFAALAAGTDHTCGRSTAGSAICWGRNGAGQVGDSSTEGRNFPVGVRRP